MLSCNAQYLYWFLRLYSQMKIRNILHLYRYQHLYSNLHWYLVCICILKYALDWKNLYIGLHLYSKMCFSPSLHLCWSLHICSQIRIYPPIYGIFYICVGLRCASETWVCNILNLYTVLLCIDILHLYWFVIEFHR